MSSISHPCSLFVRDARRRYQPANADQIIEAARQVVDRRMQRGSKFDGPSAMSRFFSDKLAGFEQEVFAAVFLDTRLRLIEYAELFFGTVDGAEVHAREVVRKAILCNAAALVVSHNHPSGDPEPSMADRVVTTRLKQALALVDIRLLDHIVIGRGRNVSLAERGWL